MNKEIIEKIENINKLSNEFDKICSEIISKNNEENISNNMYNLTNLYLTLRYEHGGFLLFLENFKNELCKNYKENKENNNEKLYDLSYVTIISEDINKLIYGAEDSYKKIALMYPNLVVKNPPILLLFTSDKNDKYSKMLNDASKQFKQYEYKIVNCSKVGSHIKCDKIVNAKLSIKIEKLPSLYLIDNNNVISLPIENINSVVELEKFI